MQIPAAERSEARVCGCALAGTAGSNSAGGMDVCLLSTVCCQMEGRSLVQRSPTDFGVSLCVI